MSQKYTNSKHNNEYLFSNIPEELIEVSLNLALGNQLLKYVNPI